MRGVVDDHVDSLSGEFLPDDVLNTRGVALRCIVVKLYTIRQTVVLYQARTAGLAGLMSMPTNLIRSSIAASSRAEPRFEDPANSRMLVTPFSRMRLLYRSIIPRFLMIATVSFVVLASLKFCSDWIKLHAVDHEVVLITPDFIHWNPCRYRIVAVICPAGEQSLSAR